MSIPTPHITAKAGDFASTVLMPGDPLRAKFIAETFLQNAVLVNQIRGINGYTGYYGDKRVSVMASGMGMPSMGIYSYELFNFYDVDTIIRIGSAGAVNTDLKIKDIVLGDTAYTTSSFAYNFGLGEEFIAKATPALVEEAQQTAAKLGIKTVKGPLMSSDVFYSGRNMLPVYKELGVLAVEMEAAALYMNAYKAGKRALAICTISDNVVTGEATSAEERQVSFTEMMKLALELA